MEYSQNNHKIIYCMKRKGDDLMIKPIYSVMIYTSEITETMLEQVENWVRSGIKVFLFTTDILEEYEKKRIWQKGRKQQFFYWFEVRYRAEYDNQTVYFVDGKITDRKLFNDLCQDSSELGFHSFNAEQFQVEHAAPDHHLFVMAGAGTGKTTVMINRLLFLKHIDPAFSFSRVAMITFTNEAAVVIRRKLQRRIRDYYELTMKRKYLDWLDELRDLEVSTIHSFAKKLLSSSVRIRSYDEERKGLIEKMIDRFAHTEPEVYQPFERIRHYHLVRSIRAVIEQLDNQSLHESTLQSIDFGQDQQNFTQLLKFVITNGMNELKALKEENNQWEVNDLIRRLYELQQMEAFRPKTNFQYIMVDEFQDTDAVQVQFLIWLQNVLHRCRLFVVGDIKQSIYRFRGADYTAFSQLRHGLQDQPITQIYLNKNYRSNKKLLEQFDSLFRHWGKKVTGFPYTPEDRLQAMNQMSAGGIIEKDFSLRAVWKDVLSKLEGKETAILVRSNDDVQKTVELCQQIGFFCEGKVSSRFYRSLPVRELYGVVRSLVLPHSTSTLYALHRSSYGENTLSHQELIQHFTADRPYALSLLEKQPDAAFWQGIREKAKVTPPLVLLEEIIEKRKPHQQSAKRLWTKILMERPDADQERVRQQCLYHRDQYETRLTYLLYLLKKHFSDSVATLYGLERFLRIRIQTDVEEQDPKVPAPATDHPHIFQCMTVHQAKGQEFDHVILPWTDAPFIIPERPHIFIDFKGKNPKVAYQLIMDNHYFHNDIFTQLKKSEREELIAEETRLLYVAMTRAKHSLFIQKPTTDQAKRINSWADLLSWKERVELV